MVWYAIASLLRLQQAPAGSFLRFLPSEMYHGTYTESAATDTCGYIIAEIVKSYLQYSTDKASQRKLTRTPEAESRA